MKVYWLFNHPAPYKINFFNTLGKGVDLHVDFERPSESDRNPSFYSEKAQNFKGAILPSLRLGRVNNFSHQPLTHIKQGLYDVIVINGWATLTEMNVIRFLKKHEIPYIFAINGGIPHPEESAWKRKLKHRYLPGAALYLAPDEHSAAYLTYYGVDATKIRFYPYASVFANQVRAKPLTPEERKALREEALIPGEQVFVSVGSFIPRKNDRELLDLWAHVSPEKTLLLIGDGPEREAYEKRLAKEGLKNVRILPFKNHDQILRYFRLADASLFLTKEDIYGHVVNESLSQGTPVIASRKSNAALNLIVDGVNGRLVDLQDEAMILKALDETITPEMSAAALSVARGNTIETMAQAHEAVFKEFIAL